MESSNWSYSRVDTKLTLSEGWFKCAPARDRELGALGKKSASLVTPKKVNSHACTIAEHCTYICFGCYMTCVSVTCLGLLRPCRLFPPPRAPSSSRVQRLKPSPFPVVRCFPFRLMVPHPIGSPHHALIPGPYQALTRKPLMSCKLTITSCML